MGEMTGLPRVWKASNLRNSSNKIDCYGGIQTLMGGVAEAEEWVGGLGYFISAALRFL